MTGADMTGADTTGADLTGADLTDTDRPAGVEDGVGERQVPFFCPYCGDEALRPNGAKPGNWDCRACARGFQLRFTGVVS
jgi:predicted RNA-binding Zn-ribbon protein involved in translation (DUF1610 family)